MNRKLERVFRRRPLTAEEAARDKEVRRAVQAEFPPATTPHESRFDSLCERPSETAHNRPPRSPRRPTCHRWPCRSSSPANGTSLWKPPTDWPRFSESN